MSFAVKHFMKIKASSGWSWHLPGMSKWFITTSLLIFIGIIAVRLSSEGADKPFGMSCMIDGKLQMFDAKAVSTPEGGIELMGHAAPWAFLSIHLPKARVGVQRLADAPGLRLLYTRDASSSDSQNHYSAGADTADTRVEVRLSQVDGPGGIAEGEFSADVGSFPSTGILHISKGQFRLKMSAQQKSAQPGGAANRSQPVGSPTNRTSAAASGSGG